MATKQTAAIEPKNNALAPYQKLDEATGEVKDIFKYLEGHPRQYRCDAKDGNFNIDGKTKVGRVLSFQPIAWRIFSDNILNMGKKNWAEVFFVDAKNCVSAVLFHGYSVDNLFRLIEPLYYDDMTLADVIVDATLEKKETVKEGNKATYYIASFDYRPGEAETTAKLKAFAKDRKVFRQETLTDIADTKTAVNYYNPFTLVEAIDALPEGVTQRDVNAAVGEYYVAETEEQPADALNG